MKRAHPPIAADWFVPTKAKRVKRCKAATHTLQNLLPELRALVWDMLSDVDRAELGRTCRRMHTELRPYRLHVPRRWIARGSAHWTMEARRIILPVLRTGADLGLATCRGAGRLLVHGQHKGKYEGAKIAITGYKIRFRCARTDVFLRLKSSPTGTLVRAQAYTEDLLILDDALIAGIKAEASDLQDAWEAELARKKEEKRQRDEKLWKLELLRLSQ